MATVRFAAVVVLAGCRTLLGFEEPAAIDAADVDAKPSPTGPHFGYVIDRMAVPLDNTQARSFGLDLNGDGTVDNQLGMVLGTLAAMGFDIQASVDDSISRGASIMLVDLQTPDFSTAAAAGFTIRTGRDPDPPACTNPSDPTTCRKHLGGDARFSIDPSAPTTLPLVGPIDHGHYTGGPGALAVQLELAIDTPIPLDLVGARVAGDPAAFELGPTIVAGAVRQTDLHTMVLPAIQAQLMPLVLRDCVTAMPPSCGCTDGSTGKTLIGLFDTNHDCQISVEELETNSLLQSLLAPDVTIDGQPALSFGVQVTAVRASFPLGP